MKPRLVSPAQVLEYTDRAWNRENSTTCMFLENQSTQCAVITELDRYVIAFAPTQDFPDVLTDLLAAYPDGVGGAHLGIWLALYSIWPSLESTITKAKERGIQVVFTGHSLGGGIALLAATKARGSYGIDAWAFVTAPPRVWAGVLANKIESEFGDRLVCYVRAGDPVPDLAPWAKTVGSVIRLGEKPWWTFCQLVFGWGRHLPKSYRSTLWPEYLELFRNWDDLEDLHDE